VTISERIAAARRELRVLARVSRAAWRLDQAERERTWALVSARAERISIRTLATASGLSPSRVHQIVANADLEPRSRRSVSCGQQAGRPSKTPTAMRTLTWTAAATSPTACRTKWTGCDSARAGRQLDGGSYPPTDNLRPAFDWPDRAVVAVDLARVGRSSTASPSTWTSSPGPSGSRTWTRRAHPGETPLSDRVARRAGCRLWLRAVTGVSYGGLRGPPRGILWSAAFPQ
jgi:hypothetical protein